MIQKILSFALRAGLDSPEKVKLLSKGASSETYQFLDREKRYIVTIFNNESIKLESILITKLSRFFSKMQFPIPAIIATGQINNYETVLTEYSSGKIKSEWGCEDYAKLGTLTANLHWAQKLFVHHQPTHTYIEKLEQLLAHLNHSFPESFKSIVDEIDQIKALWPTDLPKGLIHGDIWPKNIFFENNHISALLDFHFPFNDSLLYDLGTILKNIYFSKANHENEHKLNAFMTAYQSILPLSEREIEFLPFMLRAKIVYTILFLLTQAAYNLPQRENFLSVAMFNLIKLNEIRELSFERTLS